MCMLCDDERAYQAYMDFLDAMGQQGKAPLIPTGDRCRARPARGPGPRARQKGDPAQDKTLSPFFCSRSINDRPDIDDARRGPRGLAKKSFTSLELTDAHLKAMEAARSLNASCWRRRSRPVPCSRGDGRIGKGNGGPLAAFRSASRTSLRPRRAHHGVLKKSSQFRADYESTITSQLWPTARHAWQAQQRRVRDGLVQRNSCFGPVANPCGREGANTTLGAGRLVGGSASAVAALLCMGRDRDRHRRLDPTAGCLHRDRRHQAKPRALLTLGRRGVRVLARPGRSDRRTVRDSAILLRSMQGTIRRTRLRSTAPCRITRPRSASP